MTLEQTLDQLEKLDQKIAQLNEQKHSEKTSKETLIAEISECKEKLAVKKEQLLANKKQLERLQAEKTDILARIDSLEEDQRWLQNEMNSNDFGENELDKSAKKKLQEKNDTISLISFVGKSVKHAATNRRRRSNDKRIKTTASTDLECFKRRGSKT